METPTMTTTTETVQAQAPPDARPAHEHRPCLWTAGAGSVFHDHDDVICCSPPAQAAAVRILRARARAMHHLDEAKRNIHQLVCRVRNAELVGADDEDDKNLVLTLRGAFDKADLGHLDLCQ